MGEEQNVTNELLGLVVVGSSAGGVEALSTLVSTLSPDFPAPVVLAQHLDPSRPSSLDVILQKHTDLPVEVVMSSSQLHPGRVYMVPSNRHVRDSHCARPADRTLSFYAAFPAADDYRL